METNEQAKVMNLPIFQHFDQSEIAVQGKSALDKFRKGEWPIFQVMKLGVVGGVGYLSWVYVLPTVFIWLGQLMAVAATGVAIVGLVFLAPVIFKGLRRLTRVLHESIIRHDPFGELEDQKNQMIANLQKAKRAKAQIKQLKDNMQNESRLSEQKAEDLKKDILLNQGKAARLRAEIEKMKTQGGKDAMGSDEYVEKNSQFMLVVSEANREGHMLEQSNNFVRKYGSRALVMQKVDQKLVIATTVADIKIKDFDATIEILKKDSDFAAKSREATDAAKSAIGFTKGWELDYALDVVTRTIADDIAATSMNLNDISSLTANFDMDSDEMFAKLDLLANGIKAGTNVTPDADQYKNPEYKLTTEDKTQAGGFGNMFN